MEYMAYTSVSIKHEEWDVSVSELAQKYLIRPLQMLFSPILFLVSLYAAFVYGKSLCFVPQIIVFYPNPIRANLLPAPGTLLMTIFKLGILYANLGGFSIVFQEIRGWGQVTGNLPFIAMLIGIFCAASVNIFNNKYYFKRFKQNNHRAIPEARLPPMMIGSFLFAGGLFLYGCKKPLDMYSNTSFLPFLAILGI